MSQGFSSWVANLLDKFDKRDDDQEQISRAFCPKPPFLLILPPLQLGDAFLVFAFAKAFEASHEARPIVVGSSAQANHRKIAKLFHRSGPRWALLNDEGYQRILSAYSDGPYISRCNIRPRADNVNPPTDGLVVHPGLMKSGEGFQWLNQGVGLHPVYRRLLSVHQSAKLSAPVASIGQEEVALRFKERFARLSRPPFLLIPHAKSLDSQKMPWGRIVSGIRKASQAEVIVDSEMPFEGCETVSIPVDQLIPVSAHCSAVIGMRSGLMDILSVTKHRKFVLYPDAYALKLFGLEQEDPSSSDHLLISNSEFQRFFEAISATRV